MTHKEIAKILPEDASYSIYWMTEEEDMVERGASVHDKYSGFGMHDEEDIRYDSNDDFIHAEWGVEGLDKNDFLELLDELIYEGFYDGGGLAHDSVQANSYIMDDDTNGYISIEKWLDEHGD